MKISKYLKIILIIYIILFSSCLSFSNQQEVLSEEDIIAILKEIRNYYPKQGYSGALIHDNNISILVKQSPVKNFNKFEDEFLEYGIDLKSLEIKILNRIMHYIANKGKNFKNTKVDLYLFYKNLNTIIFSISDIGPSGIGIVFYVTDNGLHGLEAAPTNWNGSGADPKSTWSNITSIEIGESAKETTIGSGLENSNAIILQSGHTNSAAKICREYTGGGMTDWFLPSRDELIQLYAKKDLVGGFVIEKYWSSSEYSAELAWLKFFDAGGDYYALGKKTTRPVRPIRAF